MIIDSSTQTKLCLHTKVLSTGELQNQLKKLKEIEHVFSTPDRSGHILQGLTGRKNSRELLPSTQVPQLV
jgi:hypothetical protein